MKFKDCKDYKKCEDGYYRYVYVIICTNHKYKNDFYIGKNKHKYILNHYTGSGKLIKQYIKEHPNEYIKLILGTYLTDEEQSQAELYYINKYFNDCHCLNIKIVSSSGFNNHTQSDKAKEACKLNLQKAREYKHNNPMSEIGRHHIGLAVTERNKNNPELLENISIKMKEIWNTNEYREKRKNTDKSKETKDRRSKAAKSNWKNQEYVQKQLEFRKTFRHKQEAKDKISDFARNARWLTDDIEEHFLRPEYWGEFIDIGFRFGRKKRK